MLCLPLLLGLPFLSINQIVADFEHHTVIDKNTNYNLLKPPVAKRRPLLSKPRTSTIEVKKMKKLVLKELVDMCKQWLGEGKGIPEEVKPVNVATLIKDRIDILTFRQRVAIMESNLLSNFQDVFQPLPHVNNLPQNVTARIKLRNAEQTIKTRTYTCPRKFWDVWKTLIRQHLNSGHIRPSCSPHASPAFIIPKADPSVLSRWVNDYRQLNKNTIADSHPLLRIDDILNDCTKGKIWGTIDMTNSFFQTHMEPADIPLTAVSTPFGLFKWTVMPMGLKNAPAIHQWRVTVALHPWIGKICHIYLDNVVVWSNTVEEHLVNVRTILQALQEAGLYCNPQKNATVPIGNKLPGPPCIRAWHRGGF